MTIESLPEVVSVAENDHFVGLQFRLVRCVTMNDGTSAAEARGLWRGVAVGFGAVFGASLAQPFAGGRVVLRSVGVASDILIGALDEIYGTRLGVTRMRSRVECAAVAFRRDTYGAATRERRVKLFFHKDEDEDDDDNLLRRGVSGR